MAVEPWSLGLRVPAQKTRLRQDPTPCAPSCETNSLSDCRSVSQKGATLEARQKTRSDYKIPEHSLLSLLLDKPDKSSLDSRTEDVALSSQREDLKRSAAIFYSAERALALLPARMLHAHSGPARIYFPRKSDIANSFQISRFPSF